MNHLVYGVGVSNTGKYKRSYTINGKSQKTLEYELWKNMLARCYSKIMHKTRSRYENCTVSENFKNFQWFAEWCNSQPGFGKKGWHLDKDILFKHNTVYSEDTCRFVPNSINSLFVKSNKSRGEYLIGVHWNNKIKKFIAQCGNTKSTNIFQKGYVGCYEDEYSAFLAYKKAKENLIKIEAEKYKEEIAKDLYFTLITYEVEETD